MTENQRKWAIEEIENSILPDACDEVAERALEYALEALSTERPKGRWIQEIHTGLIGDTNEYNDTYFFRCSICGRTVFEKEPYCHCGADCRGEEE